MSGIQMYWWDDRSYGSNFGDAVSPRIVKALSKQRIHKLKAGSTPRVLAVGSILKWAQPGDQIWGSGHAVMGHPTDPGVHVFAVRGPLTRAALLATGIRCPDTYGDPALLLPMLYGPREPERRYRVGVIPHYIDQAKAKEVLGDVLEREDVLYIDILSGSDNVIDALCSCDLVVSSSLHGIVVADAYRIPSIWVEFSDQVVGGGMKFRDYYLSLRDDFAEALDWREAADLTAAEMHASLSSEDRLREVQLDLLASAPFPIVYEDIADVAPHQGWIDTWDEA